MRKAKELSLGHKSQLSNTYISKTRWRKPLIFQTLIILSIRIYSLKYLRFTTFGCRAKEIRVCGNESIPVMN